MNEAQKKISAYLHPCFEGQEGISRVAHLEYAPEAVLGQVANLENLQVGRHRAEVELGDDDVVDDDGRLGRLVEGGRQEIAGAGVEGRVGRQRRPVEVEGHVELAPVLETHRSQTGWTDKSGAAREGGICDNSGCERDGDARRCDAWKFYRDPRMGRRKYGRWARGRGCKDHVATKSCGRAVFCFVGSSRSQVGDSGVRRDDAIRLCAGGGRWF